MESKKVNKIKVVVSIIVVLLLVILILVALFVYNDDEQTNEVSNENIQSENTNINENNTLIAEVEEPVQDTSWQWQHDTLENHNIDRNVIDSVHQTIDQYPINAEVIVRNGIIVDEYYKDDYDQTSSFTLQSTSKSITSAIFGIAMEQGYIDSVDTPISTYFPQVLNDGIEYKRQITVWNLLTHTTGLDVSDTANWDTWLASDNWVDYVLNRPAVSRPETTFNYFTGNTHLLSAIIQQTTGRTTLEYGRENLFSKLDMDSVECTTDPQGISDGGNGFAMNVYDMAKMGQLYLNNGVWEGEQVIPQEWVQDSTTVQFDRSSGSADYGYQWWVRTFGDNNYHAYFAQGHFGQYIFVVPELELVVVMTSHYEGSTNIYWQLMNNIVNACS